MAQEIFPDMAKVSKVESEEEEEEDFVVSKPKTVVKFVVESEEISKPPLAFELNAEQPIANGSVKRIEKTEQSSEINISEQLRKEPQIRHEAYVNKIAEKFVGEAMRKAYQDLANTGSTNGLEPEQLGATGTDQSRGLPQQVLVYEDNATLGSPLQTQSFGQFYPQNIPSQPQTLQQQPQVKVQLHETQDVTAPRPEWSTPLQQQPPFQEAPRPSQRTFANKPSEKPVSHQKLAEEVAQKAISNYQAQMNRSKLPQPVPVQSQYTDPRQNGPGAPPAPGIPAAYTTYEAVNQQPSQFTQSQSGTAQRYEAQVQPQAYNQQQRLAAASPIPISQGNIQELEQRVSTPIRSLETEQQGWQVGDKQYKWNKVHDPTSWVMQESVTANQLVKGAPWARHHMEKQHRVWPPPPPKMCLVVKEEPSQIYASTTTNTNTYTSDAPIGHEYQYVTNITSQYPQTETSAYEVADLTRQTAQWQTGSPRPYQVPASASYPPAQQATSEQATDRQFLGGGQQYSMQFSLGPQMVRNEPDKQFVGGQHFSQQFSSAPQPFRQQSSSPAPQQFRQKQFSPAPQQPFRPQQFSPAPQPFGQKPANSTQSFISGQTNQQYEQMRGFRPIRETTITPNQPIRETTITPNQPGPAYQQQAEVQQYGPVKPAIFNPYSTAKYATPVVTSQQRQQYQQNVQQPASVQPLYQPLTLDTSQTEGSYYEHQQQSPRLLYRANTYNPDDVTRAVPPSKPATCTPILPFTKQMDQQDFDKFQGQYSPVRMATGQYNAPESHQYVTNEVKGIKGGTSFARVQNIAQINYDPHTGQPYKENITRVVRTTRTVPKYN